MLLPKAFADTVRPEFLLAFETGGKPVGAAAFSIEQADALLVRVRVIRTHRRQGIGSELLHHVLRRVREKQRSAISASIDSLADPEAERFLLANGFVRIGRVHVLDAELEPMRAALARLLARARRSRRLPPSARIVPLSQAPAQEVARIYEERIEALRRLHPALIQASLTDERCEPSLVLLVDGHVAAILIGCHDIARRLAMVSARAVLDRFRGGLANIWIMSEAAEQARAAGIERIRFEALDDNHDTRRLAQRFGADTIHIWDRFQLDLT